MKVYNEGPMVKMLLIKGTHISIIIVSFLMLTLINFYNVYAIMVVKS